VYDVTPTLSVNNQGQITQVENNTIVESINSGTGITVSSVVNDQVTTSLVSVNNTTVVPETYSSPTITVNQQGQITNAYETIQDSPVNSAYIYDDFFNGPVTPFRGDNGALMGGDTLWNQYTSSVGVGGEAYSVAENTVSSNECGVLTLYTTTTGICSITIKKGLYNKCTIYQTMIFEIRLRFNSIGAVTAGSNGNGGAQIFYNSLVGFFLRYNNTGFSLPFIPVLGQWYKYTIIITPGFPHPILSFYIDNVKIVTSGITPGFPDFIPTLNEIDTDIRINQTSSFPTTPTTSTSIDYVTLSVVDNNPR
jgi:hypothetical protein